MRLTSIAAPLTIILSFTALTACASDTAVCAPSPLEAAVHENTGNYELALSAARAGCDPRNGSRYSISVRYDDSVVAIGGVEPARDGSFSVGFALQPEIMDATSATIIVTGSVLDICDDTGDCQGYQVELPRVDN